MWFKRKWKWVLIKADIVNIYLTWSYSWKCHLSCMSQMSWMLGSTWRITRCLNDSLVQSGHPVRGLGGRHKASVAMAVWHEQRRILALEPNASLIFSLASLQLSIHNVCFTVKPTAVCHSPVPSNIPCQSEVCCILWGKELCKDTVSRENGSWDGSLRSQWPRLGS